MRFWVIDVTWSEGPEEQAGVLSVMVPPRTLYIGSYQKGDQMGAPIGTSQFLAAIDEG